MYINWKRREIVLTLVLYGPQGSGKTTSWRYWARNANAAGETHGDTFSLRLENIRGKQLILNIRDTCGQESAASQRRVALFGVDGLIFVADSDPACQGANRRSLNEMQANLIAMQKSTHTILFQYNKRDLSQALPIETLQTLLNPQKQWPFQETRATAGAGLADTLKQATDLILMTVLQK